jgi:hypothetical protein
MYVLLSLVDFPVHFQAPVDDELWKEEDDQSALQCNFVFFVSLYVMLSFPCTVNCFPGYGSNMSTTFFSWSLQEDGESLILMQFMSVFERFTSMTSASFFEISHGP